MSESAYIKPEALVGQTIAGRYRLTRKVGEGGMGAVYEAVQEALNRTVAVKILREQYAGRPEVARRLLKEAQLASSIEHEHIVRILDSGTTDDGRPFVVMEHLRGESLAEKIRREGALPETFVIDVALQAASALDAAHTRSIIHRDVKPENLFLVDPAPGVPPSIKIVDFGISKSMAREPGDSNLRLTATGMVLGTPLYMSPEQARGDDSVDHRVDVYALGVILYEALTGEVPFRANNYLGVISQVLGGVLVAPRTLRPELALSPGIEHVILRAMSRDANARYPTMASLRADLERVRDGKPLDPVAADEAPRAPARAPSRPWWPVGVVVGVAAFAVLTWPRVAPKPTLPTVAPPPMVDAAVGLDASLAVSPLSVMSDPSGAEIFLDDRSYGTTPRAITLPRGEQRLTLRLTGYEDATAPVVAGVDQKIDVKLRALPKPAAKKNDPKPSKTNDAKPAARPGEETLPNPY